MSIRQERRAALREKLIEIAVLSSALGVGSMAELQAKDIEKHEAKLRNKK